MWRCELGLGGREGKRNGVEMRVGVGVVLGFPVKVGGQTKVGGWVAGQNEKRDKQEPTSETKQTKVATFLAVRSHCVRLDLQCSVRLLIFTRHSGLLSTSHYGTSTSTTIGN